MPPMKSFWVLPGLVAVWVQCLGTATFGQAAVAFTPTIGSAPSGQTMTVTPAVSADRRYVRLSVNPFFNTVNGFSSFTTPLGVSAAQARAAAVWVAAGWAEPWAVLVAQAAAAWVVAAAWARPEETSTPV